MAEIEFNKIAALFGIACVVVAAVGPTVALATTDGPDIAYSNPSITPATLYAGSAINASVTVENTGGTTQDYNATLTVDGAVVAYETGSLVGGETATVSFTKTLWTTGDRDVAIGGLTSQTVTVEEANAKYHGGPGNLGYYPNQSGPLTEPVELWNITDGTPQVMQPTIVGDTLYTAFHDGGKFYALDRETGEEKWNATPGGSSGSTWTTAAYANGVLYLGSNDYKLHAINATDGTEIWNYSTQTNVRSAPAVVDGVVYFGSNDGNVTAVNATTGEELWYYTMYQPILVESNPAVVDGVVYIAANDDNVTALNATTGDKIWNYTLIDESQSDPTVANDTVFVGSDSTSGQTSGDGQVYAINSTDGTKRWNYSMAGDVDSSQVYAEGVVYAASRGGDLVALDAVDGTKIWNATGSDFRGAPVVAGDVLYISDFGNQTVHAFDIDDGNELWYYDSPTSSTYPTVLAWDGILYYGSASHFYAIGEPGPSITNVNVTNPSGQNVQISFDSNEQLSNVSVSLSGAESATLTEGDFTETGSGPYTYNVTYAGSSDGTYTATVDTAENSDGKDGGSGQSDSVDIDTTAPTVSNFTLVEASDMNVTVSFDSSEQLGSARVVLTGPESAALTLANLTESGSSPYAYTATYNGTSNGTYTATLDYARDSAANDGASSESDDASIGTAVVSSSVMYVSGTQPSMSDIELDARFSSGLLQVQAKNSTADYSDNSTEQDYELAGLGADETTVLRLNLTVQEFTPRALIGSAHDVTWTRTDNGDGTWNVSISGSPAAIESFFYANGSSPSSWPGTHRANESQDSALTFAVDDLETMSSSTRERLNGSILVTDAQEFGTPQYNTSGANDRVELHVKAPHFATDGSNNTGFFEAFMPQSVLDEWGVSPGELAGKLDGATRETTVTAVDGGGAKVEFSLHYSEVDAAITVDTVAPTADAGVNQSVEASETAQFDATGSTDNVRISNYVWDFGDGTNATGETPSNTYATPGNYTVTLNVTDPAGNFDTDTVSVTVTEAESDDSDSGSNDGGDSDDSGSDDGSSNDRSSDDNSSNDRSSDDDESRDDDEVTKVTIENSPKRQNESESTSNVQIENATPDTLVEIVFDDVLQNATADSSIDAGNSTADDDDGTATNGIETTPRVRQSNISVANMKLNLNREGSYSMNVTTREVAHTPTVDDESRDSETQSPALRDPNSARSLSDDDRAFVEETGARPTGYISVEHPNLADENIDDVTFAFRVNKEYLETAGVSATSVALYRDETIRWNQLPTTVIGETPSDYIFEARSPGLSEFVIGATAPTFEVTETELDTTRLSVGESASVTTEVTNIGGGDGKFTLELRRNGETAVSETVSLASEEEVTVVLDSVFDAPGSYDLSVNGVSVGSVEVEALEQTNPTVTRTVQGDEATDSSTLALVALVVVVLSIAALAVLRREMGE